MRGHTFLVPPSEAGKTVTALLRAHLGISWSEARGLIGERRVWVEGAPCGDATRRLKRGQRVDVRERAAARPRPQAPQPVIRFADAHVVVVDKPAGLTTMRHTYEAAEFGSRGRRFLPATLADLLPQLLAPHDPRRPPRVRAVHRLDKETSGLVVFARTPEAERDLGRQFREHTVERRYLAAVRGHAKAGRIESRLVRDRGDGRRGSTSQPGGGQRAVTHVRVLEELGDFTLVECRLESGRTHQVRIHLGEAGTPLCGERVYDRALNGPPVIGDPTHFPRPALHAAVLGFDHPASGKRMTWTAPLPGDMADLLARLRRTARGGPAPHGSQRAE